MVEAAQHPVRIVQQIRDHHYQAATAHRRGEAVERRGKVGAPSHLDPVEGGQNSPQVAGAPAGRDVGHHPVVERRQANGVALPVHQPSERRGEVRSVRQLRHRGRAVAHRRRDVEQQPALDVCLLFEPLDVVPVAPGVHLPVERREIVPRHVGAVLGELDAEAGVGAAVQAEQEPFDDGAGAQLHRAEAGDHDGVEQARTSAARLPPAAARTRRHHIPLDGAGTVSSSRAMIASTSTPSDSA